MSVRVKRNSAYTPGKFFSNLTLGPQRHFVQPLEGRFCSPAGVAEKDDKLVATQSPDRIGGAEALHEQPGKVLE